ENDKKDNSPDLNTRISKLTSDIEKMVESCAELRSQSSVSKFFTHEDNANAIKGINESIGRAIRMFQGGTVSIEQKITRMGRHLDRLTGPHDPNDPLSVLLPYVADARHDSSSRIVITRCFEGTRSDLLEQIFKWADDTDAKPIYWLCGLAGIGKSTIAQTVAERFDRQGMLGASFFFSRDVAQRSNPLLVFTTLSYSLALYNKSFRSSISASIQENPQACKAMLQTQMERLIAKPLHGVKDGPSTVVIVIDALDECSNEPLVQEMMVVLASTIPKLPFRTRVFLTSRPDIHIRSRFHDPIMMSVSEKSFLHDIDITIVQHDIGLYLSHQLRKIGEEMLGDKNWPAQPDVDSITEKAKGLFMYASASVAYIGDREYYQPKERLKQLLAHESAHGGSPFADIDKLYCDILRSSLPKLGTWAFASRLQSILGVIVLLQDPLSASSMEKLMALEEGSIRPILSRLHAVLSIPEDSDEPVQVFHQSFLDWMVDPDRCNESWLFIDPQINHTQLALHCLNLMNSCLRRNICDITQNHVIPNADIPNLSAMLVEKVGFHLLYACRFWAIHLRHAHTENEFLRNALAVFVNTKMMYWLEALSLSGRLDSALSSLKYATEWYQPRMESKSLKRIVRQSMALLLITAEKFGVVQPLLQSMERNSTAMHKPVSSLLYDCRWLLSHYFRPISISASNIYLSALPFIPNCDLFQTVESIILGSSIKLPKREEAWGNNLAVLRGHSNSVLSVCFSPDRSQIATGSHDHTVRLWNSTTGVHVRTLEGHSNSVMSVCFSPEGSYIASGSHDDMVCLWDSTTGAHIRTLEGHSNSVLSVCFSPEGYKIASGSHDHTVRLWSTTGAHIKTLGGHSDSVWSVCFSPDGSKIASGSHDRRVCLWDSTTGAHIRTLEGYSQDWVWSVCFSPDGSKVASGSDDHMLHLWDSTTGAHIRTLAGHSNSVLSVCFSPDGSRIASGSRDHTVNLWVSKTGAHIRTLKGHSDWVRSVCFFPDSDGSMIASGSDDHMVHLWDSTTEAHIRSPEGHSDSVWSVCFSPDGSKIASGSHDCRVCLWDSTTGAHIKTLEGHSNSVQSVCFSPDGSMVISKAEGCSITWDSKTFQQVQVDPFDSWQASPNKQAALTKNSSQPNPNTFMILENQSVIFHSTTRSKYVLSLLPFPDISAHAFHNNWLVVGTRRGQVQVYDLSPAVINLSMPAVS
ncbi:hypothetical protein FRC03_002168, partial [Tulasnella sp. 419]